MSFFGARQLKFKSLSVLLALLLFSSEASLHGEPQFFNSVVEAPSHLGTSEQSVLIPQALGSIESFHSGSKKTIYFIQDAHDSIEAQENIARMIHELVKTKRVKTVFEEGYQGVVPTDDYFNLIEDAKIKEEVAYFLMDQLRIGGAEYAHIHRAEDFQLIGVDDTSLHHENIQAYREVAARQEETEVEISRLQEKLQSRINREFPQEIKSWLKKKRKYENESLPLPDYLTQTFAMTGSAMDLSLFPQIMKVLEGKAKNEEVKVEDFFRELQQWEEAVVRLYLKNEEHLKLFRYAKQLDLFKRLNRLQLSYEEYKASRMDFQAVYTKDFMTFLYADDQKPTVTSRLWEVNIQRAMAFYEIAERRDLAVEENLRQFVTGEEDSAILVFGGFHSEQIQNILKKLQFSYYVIRPKIENLQARHHEYYKQLMADGKHAFEIPFHVARAVRALSVFAWQREDALRMIALMAEGVERIMLSTEVSDRSLTRRHLEGYAVAHRNELRMKEDDFVELQQTLQRIAASNETPLQAAHVALLIQDIRDGRLRLSQSKLDIVTADQNGKEKILGRVSRTIAEFIYFPDGSYQQDVTKDMESSGRQLPHRVSNVIVMSPNFKEIVLMREAGRKKISRFAKMFGGHVESAAGAASPAYELYDETARKELAEELEFDFYFGDTYVPRGKLERIENYGAFASQPYWKNHRITLYAYVPTGEEMRAIRKYQKYLDAKKKRMGASNFLKWLRGEKHKNKYSLGEVAQITMMPIEEFLESEESQTERLNPTLAHVIGQKSVRDKILQLSKVSENQESEILSDVVSIAFAKIQSALERLPEDFKMKYRVSYELMSTDEAAKDLAALREGKDGDVIFDAVMEVFRKKGIMLGEAFDEREKGQSKDTYHMTLRLNTEHAFVSAHDVLEYIEAQINAREDVEDLRDTERAVAYVRELMGGEDLEPLETTEILEVGDLLVWRQLKLDLAKLSWHKPRSELRNNEGDEQVDAPPIIEKSREEIQAKPETIEELIQALKDDEMMLWAAEQLDTKNLDDDAKMKALKTLFKGRSIPTQLKTARLANLAFRIVLLKRPHEAYFFEGIPDIALYPDLMEFLTETVMERVRGIKASTILNIANPEEHPILLRKSAEALEQSALEIDQLVSEAGLQISYKAGPTIKKVDPKILFLSPETLKENLRILSARGIDHVSYEALLIASTEKLAANLNLLIDSYGFTAMEAAQVAANATRTLIINHGLLTALQIPVTARLMKETSKHLIARIRSGKLKSDLPVASVERILKEFESFSDGIREQFNHRSELRRFQNQIDDVLVRLKQEERLSSVPELYSALKDLTGRYAVILDVKHFRLFSKKQRQEFYKAFSLYDQNKKIRFVFYAAEDEPLDEVLQELLDFSRVFKQLKVVSKLANVDFKDRLLLNFSKQGSVSVSRQYFEESLSKAKKRFDIIYRSRDQEGLLLAALLLLESGNEAVVRNQMALRNIANQLNSQIQQLLEAFHYIGRSA